MHRHQLSTRFINFIPRGCIACWKCIEACPEQVIGSIRFLFHRHAAIASPDACIGCGRCIKVCPRGCFQKWQTVSSYRKKY